MPYNVDELLDHTAEWVMMVYEEVERHRMDELKMQLAMRGIDPDKVIGTMEEAEKEKEERIIIAEGTLGALGLGRTIRKQGKA